LSIWRAHGKFAAGSVSLSERACMASALEQFAAILGRSSAGSDAFAQELVSERAAALGRAGNAVETAMARLNEGADGLDREALLKAAAHAVWAYFVQREALGLRDQKGVIAHYAIPKAVLARLGAR
jgi:hypothetical protein